MKTGAEGYAEVQAMKPVDVLTIMDLVALSLDRRGEGDHAKWMEEARSAVAELIAANRLLIEQYDAVSEFTMGGALTNAPFLLIKETLERIA